MSFIVGCAVTNFVRGAGNLGSEIDGPPQLWPLPLQYVPRLMETAIVVRMVLIVLLIWSELL
jgi:hypothetical protein